MKRTLRFVEPVGAVQCTLSTGEQIEVPVVAGFLKHPSLKQLPLLLGDPDVLYKYTIEILRRAPWRVVRLFPRDWLMRCMETAELKPARRDALLFMLGE